MNVKELIASQTHKLRALISTDKDAQQLIGRAVSELLRSHLLTLNRARHRGLYVKGFYAQAADSVHFDVQQQSATRAVLNFVISKLGIAQRYYGGPINPKKAKLLTIPNWKQIAASATHGAREFDNLFFIKFKSGAMALADKGGGTYKGKRVKGGPKGKGQLRIFYWLVKSVQQKPDSSVLPREQDIQAVAYQAVLTRINQMMKA